MNNLNSVGTLTERGLSLLEDLFEKFQDLTNLSGFIVNDSENAHSNDGEIELKIKELPEDDPAVTNRENKYLITPRERPKIVKCKYKLIISSIVLLCLLLIIITSVVVSAKNKDNSTR